MSLSEIVGAVTGPDAFFELLDPDVMWYSADVDSNVTCNSEEDVRACLQRAIAHGLTGRWEPVVEGDDVIVVRPVVEGAELNPAFHQVFRLRDGLIVEMRDYRTREDALRAVGIR